MRLDAWHAKVQYVQVVPQDIFCTSHLKLLSAEERVPCLLVTINILYGMEYVWLQILPICKWLNVGMPYLIAEFVLSKLIFGQQFVLFVKWDSIYMKINVWKPVRMEWSHMQIQYVYRHKYRIAPFLTFNQFVSLQFWISL